MLEFGPSEKRNPEILKNVPEIGRQGQIERGPIYPHVVSMYIALNMGQPMEKVDTVEAYAGKDGKPGGLREDRYLIASGTYSKIKRDNKTSKLIYRDVTLFDMEELEEGNRKHGMDFKPEDTRRNIFTEGVDWYSLMGRIVRIGDTIIRISSVCEPCDRPSNLSGKKGFKTVFEKGGGVRAEILADGLIKKGDQIFVIDFSKPYV